MRRAMTAAVPILVLALSPATAGAQEGGEGSAAIVDTITAEPTGSLDRETFYYPGGQRRDPFEPLSAGDELGPRFEDLNLSGIVYSPTTGSIAVLTDRATGKRYRVWEGDLIGGAKLVRVRASEVDFVVSAFGVSRQETLRLKSQDKEQGG
jgi:hypothetical protein